jgi:beta-lactamase superfamily II metal-dependent hydrolase
MQFEDFLRSEEDKVSRNKALPVLAILVLLLFAAGCDGLISAMPSQKIEYADFEKELIISVIDVGQGSCVFIALPNGETMLIDAGERKQSQKVISYIKDAGFTSITYLVATHPHVDHIGGISDVIGAFRITNMYMPQVSNTTFTFERMLDTIEKNNLTVTPAKAGVILFDFGGLKAEFIAPHKDAYDKLNNYSAVVLLTYNGKQFIFMGDAETESESEILSAGYHLRSDVLLVGHHGGYSATARQFASAVNPKYAIISVGPDNDFNHPASSTLSALKRADIWRTDLHGTIVVTCDGDNITVRGENR